MRRTDGVIGDTASITLRSESIPSGNSIGGNSFQDGLTLSYDTQKWNAVDCRR